MARIAAINTSTDAHPPFPTKRYSRPRRDEKAGIDAAIKAPFYPLLYSYVPFPKKGRRVPLHTE